LPQHVNELRIEEIELPDPEPELVEVKLFASGICHSQLHENHRERMNTLLLGHETTA